MGGLLNKPITEVYVEDGDDKKRGLVYGVAAMQGWRPAMEDAHAAVLDLDTETSLFGVFDGHGSGEVAEFSAVHLPIWIQHQLSVGKGDVPKALRESFRDFDADLLSEANREELEKLAMECELAQERAERQDDCSDDEDEEEDEISIEMLRHTLENAPQQGPMAEMVRTALEAEIAARVSVAGDGAGVEEGGAKRRSSRLQKQRMEEARNAATTAMSAAAAGNGSSGEDQDDEDDDDEDYEDEEDFGGVAVDSGATAVVAVLRQNKIFVANAGDSRCVLCRGGEAVALSSDHSPDVPTERRRIYAAGGYVTEENRINGNLNLSRALGDHRYKRNPNVDYASQMITAAPDIVSTTLTSDDEFMVLACDGIWNVKSSEEVIKFVREKLVGVSPSSSSSSGAAGEPCSSVCRALVEDCLADDPNEHPGSDNMTCLIVDLRGAAAAARGGKKRKGGAPVSMRALRPRKCL